MLSPLSKIFRSSGSPPTEDSPNIASGENVTQPDSKDPFENHNQAATEDVPDEEVQDGVAQVNAITMTWTKTSLATAYILMWLLYFVNAFQFSITGNLSAYVTSGFQSHSLIPIINIVSSAMSAATYMPVAKIINLWDRSIGFLIMAMFMTIGLVLSAASTNIGVYCAAQVFTSVGYSGMTFCIDVITADTSSLRDRGLAYAFTSSPYIITAFAGPAAAEHFYALNWRWGYGCFAIILPIISLLFFSLLRYNRHLAKKKGLLTKKQRSGRTLMQNVVFYVIEFDLLGVFLLAAGLVLFLLPFSIAGSTANDWASAPIIVMLVIGVACLVAFGLVERFVAPVPFLPWGILASRTVVGACLLDVSYQIAYYCWNGYYVSYLQVVHGTSITTAGMINSIFGVVSGVWLFGVGLLIKRTSRFRWLFFCAVPLYMLGVGLMIYFRKPRWSIGYMIMCQIFLAFAGGTMIICQQVAVQSVSDHNNVASALAILSVFGTMGGAVGSSISGAIWTHTLPGALKRLLPASAKDDWEKIYDSIKVQLSYEKDSPVRHAISFAYAEAQSRMLIAGTAIMALSLVWMFVVRDVRLAKQQTKGVLF